MVQLFPGVPASCLCDMYLNSALNEGLNLLVRHHMKKGYKIDGWIRNGCFNLPSLDKRISELLVEAKLRGHTWNYALEESDLAIVNDYKQRFGSSYDCDPDYSPGKGCGVRFVNRQKLFEKCQNCKRREKCKEVKKCDQRLKEMGLM